MIKSELQKHTRSLGKINDANGRKHVPRFNETIFFVSEFVMKVSINVVEKN